MTNPPPSLAIPMDLERASRINTHMVCWYLHATMRMPEETPPPLTYTLGEMVEAAAIIRNRPEEKGKVGVKLDDRAIAALYVVHHHMPLKAEVGRSDPILHFPSPKGEGIDALLFLNFQNE